jgi:hypothetical protein
MPLSEADVLNTLSDPVTLNMNFWVGPVHISGKAYGVIRDHVRAGNILVVPGTSNLAFYNDKTDILTTQAGNSPATMDQRSQLLHECTHALIDVFTNGIKVTRHIDELAAYLAQFAYKLRSNPAWAFGPNDGSPWSTFFSAVLALNKRFRFDTAAGNGGMVGVSDLEPLRLQLAALPGVNYGDYKKDDPTGADGLTKNNPFLDDVYKDIKVRRTITSHETYPDPNDEYLIRTLLEQYVASDVAGYGKRLRSLRKDFALCSLGRARELKPRLSARRRGDRVSELFHDRLSTAGRAILLRVLGNRTRGP